MGFDVAGIYSNSVNYIPRINHSKNNPRFLGVAPADSFVSNNPKKYISEIALSQAINNNPKITQILSDIGVQEINLNLKELDELLQGHSTDVQNISKGIIENLPFSLKNYVNPKAVSDASYLHDLGKVLIPQEILNKNGKLTEDERKIMHKHSELGYELLKNTDIDKYTLDLIKNHHQNPLKTGYPFVSKDWKADINLQILSLADKYSALTEDRVYHNKISPEEALTIIYKDVKDGKINPLVFNSLVTWTKSAQQNRVPQV